MKSKQEIIFKDLFEIPIKNGLFKPTKVRGSGTKMINMGEIFAIDRIFDVPMELVPLTDNEEKNSIIEKNDLIFARSSLADDAGKCSIFLGNEKTTFESHIIRVRINPKIANSQFYYYYFNSPSGKNSVYSITEKTAASGIRSSDLANLLVPFPNKNTQDNVVKQLENLDINIENLQDQNDVLEQTIRAIFKSWFIDFDGVTEWNDSELGTIPKGWKVKKLGDFISIDRGLSYKGKFLSTSGTPLINLGNIQKNGGFRENKIKHYVGEYKTKHVISSGDIVIANTDISQDRLILGSPAIIPTLESEEIIFTHHIFVVRNNSVLKNNFLYNLLKLKNYHQNVISYATGTTVLAIPKEAVLDFQFVFSNNDLINKFEKMASDIQELFFRNNSLVKTLTKTRDALLPKLMSGEIRV